MFIQRCELMSDPLHKCTFALNSTADINCLVEQNNAFRAIQMLQPGQSMVIFDDNTVRMRLDCDTCNTFSFTTTHRVQNKCLAMLNAHISIDGVTLLNTTSQMNDTTRHFLQLLSSQIIPRRERGVEMRLHRPIRRPSVLVQ